MFINNSGTPVDVNSNLFTIVSQDLGFGTSNVPGDTSVVQVTYDRDPANVTPTALRIEAIVNDPGTVVVTGLPTGTVFIAHGVDAAGNPVDETIDITGNGITWVDRDSGNVEIAYDTGQCNGQGIWTVGEDGVAHISTPNPVVLYHELSHAFHHLKGTIGATSAAEEQAAEVDENLMRDQVGLPRRLTTDHTGGCGGVGTGPTCRVVTAAFRSENTGEGSTAAVRWLHSTRGALLPRYGLGGELVAQAYAEYLDISWSVADTMSRDPVTRRATRAFVVEPLLQVYAVAAARWLRDTTTGHGSGQLSRARHIPRAATANPPSRGIANDIVNTLRSALGSTETGFAAQTAPNSSNEIGAAIAEVARAANDSKLIRWAIIEPLCLYWETAAEADDFHHALLGAIEAQAADWIGRAPSFYRTPPTDPDLFAADVRSVLARIALTSKEREALARRLVELYAMKVDYDLAAVVADAMVTYDDDGMS